MESHCRCAEESSQHINSDFPCWLRVNPLCELKHGVNGHVDLCHVDVYVVPVLNQFHSVLLKVLPVHRQNLELVSF